MDLALLSGLRFKEALRQIRKSARIPQTKLAELTGVSQPVVSAWEKGEHYPQMERLALMEQIFNLPRGTLLVRVAYEMLEDSNFEKARQVIFL